MKQKYSFYIIFHFFASNFSPIFLFGVSMNTTTGSLTNWYRYTYIHITMRIYTAAYPSEMTMKHSFPLHPRPLPCFFTVQKFCFRSQKGFDGWYIIVAHSINTVVSLLVYNRERQCCVKCISQ